MAEKIISPGVFTSEIDQSFLPAAVGEIGAAIVGPTLKGPVMTPTVVSSYSEFSALFGSSFRSGSSVYRYLSDHTAEEYFKSGNKATIIRIISGSSVAAKGYVSVSGVGDITSSRATNVDSPGEPFGVSHSAEYEQNAQTDSLIITNKDLSIEVLKERSEILEKKVKLVKPSWYENKWLYFTYGVIMTATSVNLAGQIVN